jgi:hypothetical protein
MKEARHLMRDEIEVRQNLTVNSMRENWQRSGNVWYVTGPWATDKSFPANNVLTRKKFRGNIRQGNRFLPTPYEGMDHELIPGQIDDGPWHHDGKNPPKSGLAYPPTGGGFYKRTYRKNVGSFAHFDEWKAFLAYDIHGNPLVPDDLVDACRNNLLANIKAQKMDLSETIGEGLLEIGTMVEQVGRFVKAVHAAWRRDWRAVARHLQIDRGIATIDTIGDNWLAYKFGWKPLLDDITNGRQNILDALAAEDSYITARATAVRQVPAWTRTPDATGDLEFVVEMKAWYEVDDNWLQGIQQLGLTNPLNTAWNIIPYSFVIDWFTGTGQFLSLLDSTLGLTLAGAYRLKVARQDIDVAGNFSHPWYSGNRYTAKVRGKAFTRETSFVIDLPTPRVRLGLDRNKLLTLLALLNQRT